MWLLLVPVVMLFESQTAQMQGPPPEVPSLQESGLRPATPVFSQFPFESVDLINGNVILRFADLHLPGNGGFDLTFVRTYNSRDAVWRFGIEQAPLFVQTTGGGEMCQFSNQKAIYWVDGSVEWTACDDGPDVLATSRYGQFRNSDLTLRMPNGLIATYTGASNSYRLDHLEDSFNNRTDFSWTTDPQGALLTGVSQDLGNGQVRQVTFDNVRPLWLYSTGPEASMTFDGKVWRYYFDGASLQLTEARPPTGPSWTFQYVFNQHPSQYPVLAHLQTPNGGTIDYSYAPKQGSGFGCSCEYYALTSRVVNDLTQQATWNFESNHLVFQPYAYVDNPDGSRLFYYLENRQGGNWFKTILPKQRQVIQSGNVLELEDFDHELLQFWPFYVPALKLRDIQRFGRHYVTQLSYQTQGGVDFFKPTSIQETGELARTTTLQYAGFTPYILGRVGERTVTVGSQQMTETLTFNGGDGFLQSRTVMGVTVSYGQGAFGNADSVTDARGKTTGLTYEWGVVKNTNTPEYLIGRSINVDGTVRSEQRGNTETLYGYDELGRVKTVNTQTPGRAVMTTTYDNQSGQSMTTSQGGANGVTTYFDGFGRPIRTVDAGPAASRTETRTEYDPMGRVRYKSYPFGNGHPEFGESMQYDGLGRLTRVTKPDGVLDYAYQAGQVAITASGAGAPSRTTTQVFDSFGDPDQGRLVQVVDPAGAQWTYSYDGPGHLTRVQAPQGPDRTWDYAGGPFLRSTTQPESGLTTFDPDEVGNVRESTDAENRTTYFGYDDNGRLVSRNAPGTDDDLTVTYDAWDNRLTVANSLVQTTFTFDTANRMRTRRDVIAGAILDQSFDYDSSDNMTHWHYPNGRVVRYDYGYQHKVTAVYTTVPGEAERTLATGVDYLPSGALKQYDYGNGQQFRSLNPDNNGRPQHWQSGPLDLNYAYDHAGNVRSIVDARPSMTRTYDYDVLDRLKDVVSFDHFDYDALGNRTVADGNTFVYDSGTKRLASVNGPLGTGSFVHDNVGNLKLDHQGSQFNYSSLNQVTSATVSGQQVATYAYDGDGIRSKRTTAAGTQYYVYGGAGRLAAEYGDVGSGPTLKREYLYLGGTLLASMDFMPAANVTVSLTSPLTGASFAVGAPVTMTAVPATSVGTITRVDFYLNGTFLESDTSSPYSITRTDLPFGPNHRLQARAVTSTGTPAVSAVTSVNVGSYVTGDFNYDGYPDLLFQNSSGGLKVWTMQGATRLAEVPMESVNPVWQVVGLADFNGDWKTDILFQHSSTGQVYVWFMNGTTFASGAYLEPNATPWRLSAAGDLNGDGQADTVWTLPSSGDRVAWFHNGLTMVSWGYLSIPIVTTDWQIVGAADLNQDGREDLVWQRTDGSLAYWIMNGLVATSTGFITPTPVLPVWRLAAAANFDLANGPDLVFQHTSSTDLYMWLMSGTTMTSSGYLTPNTVGGTWKVVGGR